MYCITGVGSMENITHNINKIILPILPDIISRDRLLKKLSDKKHFSITWLTGKAGSGKTTLVADYLQKSNLPHIWYRVDSGDNDLSSFFYYFGLAIKNQFSAFQGKMPLLTQEYGNEYLAFSRKYFQIFSNNAPLPLHVVFDNSHAVNENSPFHHSLKEGIAHLAPKIHTIIISRKAPPAYFTSMIAENHMRIIDNFDLSFSYSETEKLIQKEIPIKLSKDLVQQIFKKSEGWAAGIILLIRSIKQTGIIPKNPTGAPLENIFDYFASELFNNLDHSFQLFLVKTALLPRFTSKIATSITGSSRVDYFLDTAINDHIFLECSRDLSTVYQYHPLFKEFLLKCSKELLKPEEVRDVKTRGAELLQNLGWIEESFELYNQLENYDQLINIVLENANSFISLGRNKTLLKWISYIPETNKNRQPWLIYWEGMGYLFQSMKPAVLFLRQAVDKFIEKNDIPAALLSWSSLTYCLFIYQNELSELDSYLEWSKNHTHPDMIYPSLELEACVAISRATALMCREPQDPDIEFWMQKTISLSNVCHDTQIWVFASSCIITFQIFTNPRSNLYYYNQFKRLAREHKTDFSKILLYLYDSLSYFSSEMSVKTAKKLAENGLKYSLETGIYFCIDLLFGLNILLAIIANDCNEAKRKLLEFELLLDHSMPNHSAVYYLFSTLFNISQHKYDQAMENGVIAMIKIRQVGFIFPEIMAGVVLSQAYSMGSQHDNALKQIEYSKKVASISRTPILEFICGLTESFIYLRDGQIEESVIILQKSLKLGKQYQFTRIPWWWNAEMLVKLCMIALENQLEIHYIRQIIHANNLIPTSSEPPPENWPFPIEISTLGNFQIIIKGEIPRATSKPKSKVLDLLKILIGFGTNKVAIELICDELWPEKDGDLAKSAFSTTLNRLRKLLMSKNAILTEGGKIGLNSDLCRIDSVHFEKLVNSILMQQGPKNNRIESLYKQAIDLYKGAYLHGEPEHTWIIINKREKLEEMYIKMVTDLCTLLDGNDKSEEALQYCREGIERIPTEESFYRYMMFYYAKSGNNAEVVKLYNQCRNNLRRSFNVAPSWATKKIYISLKKDN